jgi:cellulose synthase/poly-beta-1,6-N-acetylglucosamine synthase-like glycosyltransferase
VIVALLPAHNEGKTIAAAIEGLKAQTFPPDVIVVIADNCTDFTVEIAKRHDALVFETVGNTAKKAGALNQALRHWLPLRQDSDLILVQDADSKLDPRFIQTAITRLRDGGLDAIGGTFRGGPGGGYVGWCQRNEYARYARDVRRRGGQVLVMTGTATVFRAGALRRVAIARGTWLPGIAGQVYDEEVLTEDNELTFAFKQLDLLFTSPDGATLETETMQTWGDLGKQRLRWKRGAFENLKQYGFPKWARPYWGRQVLTALGVLVTFLYLGSIALTPFIGGHFSPKWMALSGVFALERFVTVRSRGLWTALAAATLLAELPYDVYLQAVHARAVVGAALGTERAW